MGTGELYAALFQTTRFIYLKRFLGMDVRISIGRAGHKIMIEAQLFTIFSCIFFAGTSSFQLIHRIWIYWFPYNSFYRLQLIVRDYLSFEERNCIFAGPRHIDRSDHFCSRHKNASALLWSARSAKQRRTKRSLPSLTERTKVWLPSQKLFNQSN